MIWLHEEDQRVLYGLTWWGRAFQTDGTAWRRQKLLTKRVCANREDTENRSMRVRIHPPCHRAPTDDSCPQSSWSTRRCSHPSIATSASCPTTTTSCRDIEEDVGRRPTAPPSGLCFFGTSHGTPGLRCSCRLMGRSTSRSDLWIRRIVQFSAVLEKMCPPCTINMLGL